MRITEVRIKLMHQTTDRLLAFGAITIDNAFVVRDLKLIMGPQGPFVAMPSRKMTTHCPRCGLKNPVRANYCNQCGNRQPEVQLAPDADGRRRLYADIAHPISVACRVAIEREVVQEYEREVERSRQPGYVSRYDDMGDEEPRLHAPPADRDDQSAPLARPVAGIQRTNGHVSQPR
jgi:stage V sporulation protein G